MPETLNITLDIQNPSLRKILAEEFQNQPGILINDPAASAATIPRIIVLEDDPETGKSLKKIGTIRRDFPTSNLFVISSDPSPDHIVEVMKAGASEYFLQPLNQKRIAEAISRVRQQVALGEKSSEGAAYVILSSKGGLGATVLAVNTAAALTARTSSRTALIDLSLQAGDSSALLDVVPKATVVDIARNFHRLDASLLAGIMEKHAAGIDLLAAPASPQDAYEISSEQVEKILSLCRRLYRSALVDCPSMVFGGRSLEAFRAAEKIFVVTDLSVPAVRNASRLLKLFQGAGYAQQKIELVVNRYVKGQTGTLEDVEKSLGRRVFWLFPNDFENAMASINRGTPLLKYNPRAALARSISEFAQKLIEPTAFSNYRGVKGLLGKAI